VSGHETAEVHPMEFRAHDLFADALGELAVSVLVSADHVEPIAIDPGGRIAVAIDSLDGAANIEINQSLGTIFTILESDGSDLLQLRPCDCQLAAGFFYFGPQTRLILSCGNGTRQFVLDPAQKEFFQVGAAMRIPPGMREFAINTSNYRFWDSNLRHFIDDCIAGAEGALGEDFNMRWNGSLVAEAFRILVRGGVFLYPGDSRPDFGHGRLRLLYHAVPLAMIIEQAGGAANDGSQRILEMKLPALHARVPLIFGCEERVREVIEYISGDALDSGHYPLFEHRGLLRI
jgi:fructose-1,6-bisphosphatase I